jgi:hypothetical protein
VYWIRNIAYNLPGGSSRLTGGAAGVVFYNNTILSETQASGTSNTHWRNNLFLGQDTAPAIFSVNTNTNYTSSDYNGFRPNPGAAAAFQWNSPPFTVRADFGSVSAGGTGDGPGPGGGAGAARGRGGDAAGGAGAPAAGRAGRGAGGGGGAASRLEQRQFPTLAAYSQATNQDRHSVLVDYDIFTNVPKLSAQNRSTVQKIYKAENFDFRLRAGSAAIDRGTSLPGVTDGFSGTAPDLGALEQGQPLPHYGPR